ncbi:MAG: T9SS type A sorting domain-containing protein [Paludibacteraceae bacterium]|nr:T9SS type A sorting domain-containing protein [Paludibacteraceae bacterium]
MKTTILHLTLLLSCAVSAQTIWYKPDSLVAYPTMDRVPSTEEYTVVTVLRNLEPDSAQLLWGFTANDTLREAVLTNGIFRPTFGVCTSSNPRDFSRWNIYYYHTGCHIDSIPKALRLGSAIAHYTKDSVAHTDTLSANIAMEEFAYFPNNLRRTESASFITYLALKYGITLDDNAAYVSPAGDTLWHNERDRHYYHRVVGIGADTVHGWASAVSQSKEQAAFTVSSTALRAGEYVIMGDNDGTLSWIPQPDSYYRLERQRQMRRHASHPVPAVLGWRPAHPEQLPDSVWLVVTGAHEQQLSRSMATNCVGDSLWLFPLTLSDTLLTLQIEGTAPAISRRVNARSNGGNDDGTAGMRVRYLPDGRILVEGLGEDDYTFILFDSSGKRIATPSCASDGSLLVGSLPQGVYHLEILKQGQLYADVPLVVN